MRSDGLKLVIPRIRRLSIECYIALTVSLVGFAAILFFGEFEENAKAGLGFCVSIIVLIIWLWLTVRYYKNYDYLHIRYNCMPEGIINCKYDESRSLPVSVGVFCTCISVKFYFRYGYETLKLYLLSEKPLDWDLTEYAGGNFIKKVWKDQMFLMPVCADTTDWIQSTYGCENLGEYPKVTYLPPKG